MRRLVQNRILPTFYILGSSKNFSSIFSDKSSKIPTHDISASIGLDNLSEKAKNAFENLQSTSVNETKKQLNNVLNEIEKDFRTGDTISVGMTIGVFNISVSRTVSHSDLNSSQK